MVNPKQRKTFKEYKTHSFVQRYLRLSRGRKLILGLLLGTYGLIGLYSYDNLNTSEPPEGLEERNVVLSLFPIETKQEKRRKERLQKRKEEQQREGIQPEQIDQEIVI